MSTLRAKTIGLLLICSAILFAITSGVAHAFHAEQAALGQQWFQHGNTELSLAHASVAVTDFRNALAYAGDNGQYRFELAKALAGSGHLEEANAYFESLWEADPGDAPVNLELARLAARRQDVSAALRYYHAAIYGLWPDDPQRRRSASRLELIDFLLQRKATVPADAELMALAAEAPDTVGIHMQVADLFVKAEDNAHALTEYQSALRLRPGNAAASAGAGRAAFRLGQYDMARQYLRKAVEDFPADASLANLAGVADAIFELDPYRPRLAGQERRSRVIRAFSQAGSRLQHCAAATGHLWGNLAAPASSVQSSAVNLEEYAQWGQLKAKVNDRALQRDPNLMDRVMDLVFQIERPQAGENCGASTISDAALQLLALRHGAN